MLEEIKRDGSAPSRIMLGRLTTGGTNDGRIMFGTDGGSLQEG